MDHTKLVIVESPAKASTISKYLGKEYKVIASYGHVRDLPKTRLGIDVQNGFKPHYLVNRTKLTSKALAEMKKILHTKESEIILATDEDREGEAIAWHLIQVLSPDHESNVQRIVFHEITKSAIEKAIANPRSIDMRMVDAQQARRILDRIVGYELSPLLWKTIRAGLSAGRVQSVALRLIVEREREIDAFKAKKSFRTIASFSTENGEHFTAELNKKFIQKSQVTAFLEHCSKSDFSIADVIKKRTKKSPPPPFTTSTLQQEASRRLGLSVRKTMRLAQQLYEEGKITYMRTDSVHLSQLAIDKAYQTICAQFGENYAHKRQFTTRTKGAQEAHEAIRPTDFSLTVASPNSQEQRLYEMIRLRALASQMSDAIIDKTTAKIVSDGRSEVFVARGEIIFFDGFLKLYGEVSENAEENFQGKLPALHAKQRVIPLTISAIERFTRPPARYSEAALVRKLEEKGIGRPSTYAPTIGTLLDRKYATIESLPGTEKIILELTLKNNEISESHKKIVMGSEKNKLIPTAIGTLVSDFLVKHFTDIVDYQFTAQIEKDFDDIAMGKRAWNEIIHDFYHNFHPRVIEKKKNVTREDAMPSKKLGRDPKTGDELSVQMGPYGLYVERIPKDDPDNVARRKLLPTQKMENITLEQALKLFDYPKVLGKDNQGNEIKAQIGPYGPYLSYGKKTIALDNGDLDRITFEEALQRFSEQRRKYSQNILKEFDGSALKIVKGKWGPYITDGKKNRSLPKKVDYTTLTEEQCRELLHRPVRRGRRKKPLQAGE